MKFLVVLNFNTGIAQLSNVGIFVADSKEEAIDKAKKAWSTTYTPEAYELDALEDWSYFI